MKGWEGLEQEDDFYQNIWYFYIGTNLGSKMGLIRKQAIDALEFKNH